MIILLDLSYLYMIQLIVLQITITDSVGQKKINFKSITGAEKSITEIIDHCFNKIRGSFVVIGEWGHEDTFLLRAMQANSQSLYLFDGRNNSLQKYKRFPPFAKRNKTTVETKVYPAYNVTIVVSSMRALANFLKDFRSSIWWNYEAHFLIINQASENGCNFARQFLNIVWNFNILSAIYLCIDNEDILIFTFNPYDRMENEFWKLAWASESPDNHWTMFQHSFNQSVMEDLGSLNCKDMELERIRNLNRLNIHIGAFKSKTPTLPGQPMVELVESVMILATLNELNATYTFKVYREFGRITEVGPTGFLKDMETGSLKVLSKAIFLRDYWKQQTYSHEFNSLCIIIPKYSDVHSLVNFALREWPVYLAVSLLSMAIINYVFRYSISRNFLEFIRLLTSGSFVGKPILVRDHILFMCISVALPMTSLFFSSRLTAYTTVADKTRQINSVDGVIESGLRIVTEKHHRDLVREDISMKLESGGSEVTCMRDVADGQKKACIIFRTLISDLNYTFHIHEVKELLSTRPSSFTVTEDWPLLSTVDLILSYFAEAGIYNFLSNQYQVINRNWSKEPQSAHGLTLIEFQFGFYLLFGGWTLAVCIFVLEMFRLKKFKR